MHIEHTENPLNRYVDLHKDRIFTNREALFDDLTSINESLGNDIKVLFHKKRKESGYAPLWGEIIPCIYKDIFNLNDGIYDDIFKQRFAVYIQMIIMDDVMDKKETITPESLYQSVLLQWKGLGKLLTNIAGSKYEKIADNMVASAFNGQLQDIALKHETGAITEKQESAINKNHLNHLIALAISSKLPQYESMIMKISELIIYIEHAFDDIQDIQEDFDEKNYSPLISRIFGNKAKNFTGDIFTELIQSGILETEFKRVKSYVGEILIILEQGKIKNIKDTSSWKLFDAMKDGIDSVLDTLLSLDTRNINNTMVCDIKSLIKSVIPI